MFLKSMAAKNIFDPGTAESLADVLYQMGKDLLTKLKYEMAVKWLGRAGEVLEGQELDRLSMNATELRTSILQSLTKALLGTKDANSAERARSLVTLLENDLGDKLVVLLLKLEVISAPAADAGVAFDGASYFDVLERMIRTVILNESNSKLIMSHIRKLRDKSPSLASKALDNFLVFRILPDGSDELLDKALVTRLWLATSQRDDSDSLTQIEDLFSKLVANSARQASSAATLAAHTVSQAQLQVSIEI